MTDEEKGAALEKLLVPIKNLYSEITTRGNKFCYPFIYTDADGDYLSYITQLIEAFGRTRQTLWGGSADANPKLLPNDT